MAVGLYLFDMDHTLIDSDCDVTWKEFLVAEGVAPKSALDEAAHFMGQYERGELDTAAFNCFQLREFKGRTESEMAELARRHFERVVKARIRLAAADFTARCIASGVPTAILTSTCEVIAKPVAEFFGVDRLLGTRLEKRDGRYTGGIAGEYFAGTGKLAAARPLLAELKLDFSDVAAYGDSINDLPLLAAAGHSYAVTPSAALRREAEKRNWPILDWNTPED